MDKTQAGKHISQQFNVELEDIRNRVLEMGGLVEQQIKNAIKSLIDGDTDLANSVIQRDVKVNATEVKIDEECSQILARRQPTASDLRLVVAVIKTITDLERIGDQAERIARMGIRLSEQERPKNGYNELQHLGEHVSRMMHDTLDAFARTDTEAALQVAKEDLSLDQEYDGIMRQSLTFMMEDPRMITRMLDVMWIARAIERIGDHAKNIGEYVIYMVRGKNVRHISLEDMEQELQD